VQLVVKLLLVGEHHRAVYMGMSLFPYTKPFLEGLKELGIGYSFLTNNPSKSIADYLHKLETLGIHATREEMYTTALATIDYIKQHYPAAKRLFLLGTPSMISAGEDAGLEGTPCDTHHAARQSRSYCSVMSNAATITSRSASPIPTCFRASFRATASSPTRSPWSATASTPTWRWPTTPKRWECWCFQGETTLDVADKADPQPHITADSIEVLGG